MASGGILASSPVFLRGIELELMICWAALFSESYSVGLWSTCKMSCPANPGGIGSIHFCLRSVSAWLGLAQRNPLCVHEGMNIKPSSLPFSCILTSLLSLSKDILHLLTDHLRRDFWRWTSFAAFTSTLLFPVAFWICLNLNFQKGKTVAEGSWSMYKLARKTYSILLRRIKVSYVLEVSLTFVRVWVQTQNLNFRNSCLLAFLFTKSRSSSVSC